MVSSGSQRISGHWCANRTVDERGVINMYGVFQTYYTKHLLQHESELKIAWIGSVQGALLLFVCFFMGPVYDAGYSTALIYLGAPCTVLGMMMTSFCTEYWQLLLAQGFVVGVGTGLIYLPGVSIISQYFKRRRALAFGIASLGSSTGTFASLPPSCLEHSNFNQLVQNLTFFLAKAAFYFRLFSDSYSLESVSAGQREQLRPFSLPH